MKTLARTPRWVLLAMGAMVAVWAVMVRWSGPVAADSHHVQIREVMAGANGASGVQFIVIEQLAAGQNLWGPQGAETQSRAMLVFYDAAGRETGIYKFPQSPGTGGSLKTLVATADFAALLGAPTPDIVIPPLLHALSGKVCFLSNPLNEPAPFRDCLSYGSFAGDIGTNIRNGTTVSAGAAAGTLPITDTVSLRRTADTGSNADFALTTSPTPINLAGATMTMAVDSQVLQGERLFNLETFEGNGRTCATCHVPGAQSFGLQPFDVKARFSALAATYDPLFVAETLPGITAPGASGPSGFDYNLNVLILTAAVATGAPCTGELRGVITAAATGGRAKVIARLSSTSYLVGGGITPALAGSVTDGTCSASVASITPGSVGAMSGSSVPGLEDPRFLRTTRADPDVFPDGNRALFLENIDQLTLDNTSLAVDPHVFRKSPHLLNMRFTAQFGFSGNIPDLKTFSAGAVKQHYPRTLVRSGSGPSPDFRLPTDAELAALEAFQLAQDFPSGTDPQKYDLGRFATSAAAVRGRQAFFGDVAKCSRCHGGDALAQMTVTVLGHAPGTNGRFNTGVFGQRFSGGTDRDQLPCEPSLASVGPCNSREFSVPQLFNVKHLTPLFHDASSATVANAVAFYNTTEFNNSPAGIAIGGICMPALVANCSPTRGTMVQDIAAFLESLVMPSLGANSSRAFTAATGSTATPSVVVRDDDGNVKSGVTVTFAVAAGGGSLAAATAMTDSNGIATAAAWTLAAGLNTLSASLEGATGSPVTFNALGISAAPSVTTHPSNATAGPGLSVSLTAAASGAPAPTIQWQVSTDGGQSFTNISGATAPTYTFTTSLADNAKRFRAVFTNTSGTATSNSATLTVVGVTMALDRTTLNFGALNTGSQFASQTGAQIVRMTQTGTGVVTWTATASQPWLQVSPSSGTGPATLTVTTAFSAGLPVSGSAGGEVTLAFSGASNTAGPIAVTLRLQPVGTTPTVVGTIDTPLDNTGGVTGSIAVTGWALDDVEVAAVAIYRDPVTPEAAGGLVFIGNAVFVEGARPDVATAYPTFPRSTRGGWGYLLLTNMLPNGGTGSYRLHAFAVDGQGRQTSLGSRAITCTNSTATLPFGAIDTPAQGEAIGGTSYNNFGWVLSPAPRRSDPPSGGSVTAYIDGAPVGSPSGWASRSDLTALFPTAQYPGAPNALGVLTFNPSSYANGVHVIYWIVTDNLGGAEGVGSRYFTIANGAARGVLDAGDADAARVGIESRPLALPSGAIGMRRPLAEEVNAAAADRRAVRGRRGFDEATAVRSLATDARGGSSLEGEELDRFELHLGAGRGLAGYLRVGADLAPLPIGSRLDPVTGVFTWAPGVAFIGSYDLVFVRWADGRASARREVRVTLHPKGSSRIGAQVMIDTPGSGATLPADGAFFIGGWAVDLDDAVGGGIDAIHVWAYPTDSEAAVFLGVAQYGGTRPDVAAQHGDRFVRSGYGLIAEGLPAGDYRIAVFAWSSVRGRFVPARTTSIVVR